MEYIHRAMEETFLRLSQEYPALLLVGPRQVGKTTMLQKLAKEENRGRGYVTLDDLTEREIAKNDPKMFLQLHKAPVLIDEIQYAPELFSYIKMYVDTHQKAGDFWLTGSQLFKLMESGQESLAGRLCLLHMSTMSQSEICGLPSQPFHLDFDQLQAHVEKRTPLSVSGLYERIWKGGMPAIISEKYKDRDVMYSSYLGTYIDRDVRDISGAVDSLRFMKFFTACAALAGQMLNVKTIADAAEISQVTAKKWLDILERLGIIFYLHPYSNNMLKRMVTKPKLYFYDSGLISYLTKWSNYETLLSGAMSGAILENFAVSEIMKSYQNAGITPYLYYYRDKDTKEIDIIMERDGTLFPVEIKKTSTPDKRLTKVFAVLEKTTLKQGMGAVLCATDKLSAFDSNNLIVPIWGV